MNRKERTNHPITTGSVIDISDIPEMTLQQTESIIEYVKGGANFNNSLPHNAMIKLYRR
jgi:hypothetical protein